MLPKIISDVLSSDSRYKYLLVCAKTPLPGLQNVQNQFIELRKKFPERFVWYDSPMMPSEISKLYKQASIYVQPSFYETFGLCILEGMASGHAVVATNVGGIPEVVGDTGFLVEPDSRQISKKVLELLKSQKLRKHLGQKSLERAKAFDWSVIASKTINLYNEVLGKK